MAEGGEGTVTASVHPSSLGCDRAFVVLYFLQWIPPIPLSVQELVVAHKVERVGERYSLLVDTDLSHGLFQGDGDKQARGRASLRLCARLCTAPLQR